MFTPDKMIQFHELKWSFKFGWRNNHHQTSSWESKGPTHPMPVNDLRRRSHQPKWWPRNPPLRQVHRWRGGRSVLGRRFFRMFWEDEFRKLKMMAKNGGFQDFNWFFKRSFWFAWFFGWKIVGSWLKNEMLKFIDWFFSNPFNVSDE